MASQLGIYVFNPMPREVWLMLGLESVLGQMALRIRRVSRDQLRVASPASPRVPRVVGPPLP